MGVFMTVRSGIHPSVAAATENRHPSANVTSFMRRRLAVGLVTLVLGLLAVPIASASATADPLGCSVEVFDPADEIDDPATQQRIAAAERSLGGDIRVRVETAVDGGLDARIAQLVAQCPGWDSGDEQLDDDLIVVMFSPTEREAGRVLRGRQRRVTRGPVGIGRRRHDRRPALGRQRRCRRQWRWTGW